ncbi:DUF4435 domain-containing protein [Photobacterium chitinilyticum]|uniref:DUF4435 domain-containing protein n=1 Tax=Photobacterium chitinilyticum TaxID=2485123 RepID=UPI0013E8F55C|nr:DUF4435 domain-containing protein [Photobacterium chitinilyticum]
MIPSYNVKYRSSIGVLYRPLQDVEIYVEDEDSSVFYNELFGRLLDGKVRIKKVIPLGCRLEVIKGAKEQNKSFPKVFIIDGDLYWVSGKFKVEDSRLYQYPFYCIENALFCKDAAIALIQETLGCKTVEYIEDKLSWDEWVDSIEASLIKLFVVFATAFKLKPTIKTTSRGFNSIITRVKKSPPIFDIDKIGKIINDILIELNNDFGEEVVTETRDNINEWVHENEHFINIVSGKDFLLPLLSFKIKEICGLDLSIDSRNFRLARSCNLDSLNDLKQFIITTVSEFKQIA